MRQTCSNENCSECHINGSCNQVIWLCSSRLSLPLHSLCNINPLHCSRNTRRNAPCASSLYLLTLPIHMINVLCKVFGFSFLCKAIKLITSRNSYFIVFRLADSLAVMFGASHLVLPQFCSHAVLPLKSHKCPCMHGGMVVPSCANRCVFSKISCLVENCNARK